MTRITATSAALLSVIGTLSYSEAFSPTTTSIGASTTTCPVAGTTTKWGHARQQQQQQRSSRVRLQSIFYDDFEDFSDFSSPQDDSNKNSNNNNNKNNVVDDDSSSFSFSDGDLFASLRKRQDSLQEEHQLIEERTKENQEGDLIERQRLNYNWNEANCLGTVRLTVDDWIRRLAVDLYPLVVCGSSRGNLYLGDLEDGDEMDCLKGVHSDQNFHPDIPDDIAEDCIQALYDGYDGNGPFAIAVKKDLIVSSGREGGIHACTIVGHDVDLPSGTRGGTVRQTKLKLQREGVFRGLEGSSSSSSSGDENNDNDDIVPTPPPLITSMAFDDRGTLWAGGYDGILRGYNHEELDADDRPLMLRQKRPDFDIDVGAPILEVSVVDETGCIVVTTRTEGVYVFSLDDGRFLLQVNPFDYNNNNNVRGRNDPPLEKQKLKQFSRTAMIVRNDNSTTTTTSTTNADEDEDGSSRGTLIVGGSYGHLYQLPLQILTDVSSKGTRAVVDVIVDAETPTPQKIRPKHMGPVVSLASPSPGLFVTASHDGTMRVWDCSLATSGEEDDDDEEEEDDDDDDIDINYGDEGEDEDVQEENKFIREALAASTPTPPSTSSSTSTSTSPQQEENTKHKLKMPKVLYALSGYKVWLGSVFANDRKLVSDGADNTVIVHSFDEDEDAILRSKQEDDEDNDLGDDPFSSLS